MLDDYDQEQKERAQLKCCLSITNIPKVVDYRHPVTDKTVLKVFSNYGEITSL